VHYRFIHNEDSTLLPQDSILLAKAGFAFLPERGLDSPDVADNCGAPARTAPNILLSIVQSSPSTVRLSPFLNPCAVVSELRYGFAYVT